jgi:hypothetical protein
MRVAYYPAGDRSFASSRLRVYKIADALQLRGHTVAFFPDDPLTYDVVVVQKRTDCAALMRACREYGVRVVYDVDDYIPDLPVDLADVVTVDTPAKRELYPNAVVIPDALDVEANSPYKSVHSHALTRAVWVGNAENLYNIHHAAQACRELGIELTVVTDLSGKHYGEVYGVRGVQWTLESADAELVEHDLCILPFSFDGRWGRAWVMSKSANRLYKAWGLGLPVAATPIPSYVEAGLQYAATTTAEWIGALTALQSPIARHADAARGYEIAQTQTAEAVANRWLDVFEREKSDIMRGETASGAGVFST